MPSCKQCKYFDANNTACVLKGDKGGRSWCRNCVTAIFREEIPFLKGKILEIGGGQWNAPRRHIRNNPECKYHGLDPRWGNCPELGGYKGTVGKIPFENDYFDRILAFETMEHWADHKESVEQGLSEIHRVLKRDCEVCITVPIHLHGSKEFLTGDMAKIEGYFNGELWKNVRYEEWRKDFEPLPPAQNWRGSLEFFTKCSTQKTPSSWTLRINATKV